MPMLTTLRMRLPVYPSHCAGADPGGEGRHLVENFVNCRDDVFTVDHDAFRGGRAEGYVEDGAVFGGVDLLAGEHGFGVPFEAGLFG